MSFPAPVDASFFETAPIRAVKPYGPGFSVFEVRRSQRHRQAARASSTAFLKRRFVSKKSSEPRHSTF